MTRAVTSKHSFTAGELDPQLLGRLDLKASEDGASRLRNVIVRPTGGVTRRSGTRHIATVIGGRRLIAFAVGGGERLLALGPGWVEVRGVDLGPGALLVSPWTTSQLDELDWTRFGDGLILCHPAYPPQRLWADADGWRLDSIAFETEPLGATSRSKAPFLRYAAPEVVIQVIRGTQPPTQAIAADQAVVVRTGAPVFAAGHQGRRVRVDGRQVLLTSITSSTEALGITQEALPNGQPTRSWDEEAFSDARGYPATITFHQERLVFGGAAGAPDRLWFSRSGRPFDFDAREGLDDEALSFRLAADRRHDILGVVSGRHLQVFTSAGEWIVRGFPLTPRTVQAELQTEVGSRRSPRIGPVGVDGATLFVGRSGREVREFLYTDTEQAYQAADLAMLARHLMVEPRAMVFDPHARLLWIIRADGLALTVAIDRNANIVAWSSHWFGAPVRAVEILAGRPHLLIERLGGARLEALDPTSPLDGAILQTSAVPTATWSGLEPLLGEAVLVLADGTPAFEGLLDAPVLTLPTPATTLVAGRRFAHTIEPVTMAQQSRALAGVGGRYRIVRAIFRLLDSLRLGARIGAGPEHRLAVAPRDPGEVADVELRALGWSRGDALPWRIHDDAPGPFTLLAATTELKVTD